MKVYSRIRSHQLSLAGHKSRMRWRFPSNPAATAAISNCIAIQLPFTLGERIIGIAFSPCSSAAHFWRGEATISEGKELTQILQAEASLTGSLACREHALREGGLEDLAVVDLRGGGAGREGAMCNRSELVGPHGCSIAPSPCSDHIARSIAAPSPRWYPR